MRWEGVEWTYLAKDWAYQHINKKMSSSNLGSVNMSFGSRCIMAQAVSGRFLTVEFWVRYQVS